MAYVIAEPCIGTKDNSCVEVCPVDCIHPTPDEPGYDAAEMLYIDPEECINCGVCEPECPWEAIFEDEQVPEPFQDDTALNAKILADKAAFRVPEVGEKAKPTPEQVEENKAKWGYGG